MDGKVICIIGGLVAIAVVLGYLAWTYVLPFVIYYFASRGDR